MNIDVLFAHSCVFCFFCNCKHFLLIEILNDRAIGVIISAPKVYLNQIMLNSKAFRQVPVIRATL